MRSKIVIGLTGPFGSGCTYIAKEILNAKGYEYISLSDILRNEIGGLGLSRSKLQDKGNQLREEKGAGYLAQRAIEIINDSDKEKFVIDSIRNTHEIECLKGVFPSFYLFAIRASKDKRWERIKEKYRGNQALFEADDKRDKEEKCEIGQQIALCYQMSDIIILNEEDNTGGNENSEVFKKLQSTVGKYLGYIENHEQYKPTEMETLMTMAYANSMRSSCLQRKVGALIIDDCGNVFSSGFNEVPPSERPCEGEYGGCYRTNLRKKMEDGLKDKLAEKLSEEAKEELSDGILDIVKKNSRMLDYCRALHAEENAIMNMARLSVSADFGQATLYTTTYPCNLCANKIAKIGFKKIVYYEPYPQEEAKKTLNKHGVKQIPFEGVTYNSYFKFMEVLR